MTVANLLRGVAVALALVGFVDPGVSGSRQIPASVELRATAASDGSAVNLVRALDGNVSFDSDAEVAARVFVGGLPADVLNRGRTPVSVVLPASPQPPNVRIVEADAPASIPAGWAAEVSAVLEARGLPGSTSTLVLERDGAEIGRAEHRWTADVERAGLTISFAPPAPGVSLLRLRVVDVPGESTSADNRVDLVLAATATTIKVLAHEPRPSWTMTFVRRALEAHPTFDVSTLVRLSRGLAVRAGEPPAALRAESLAPFDVVLIGAPGELTSAEVDALREFATHRGGTVVLLPDRRPAGPYLALTGTREFDEVLVSTPLDLQSAQGTSLRASELSLPRGDLRGLDVLASTPTPNAGRPVVFVRPMGEGRVVFSGALDAWRHRGHAQQSFTRFWQAAVAEAGLARAGRLEVEINPRIARPGDDIVIRARLRQSEMTGDSDRLSTPVVAARAIGSNGVEQRIRLWPASAPGLFETRIKSPAPGTYEIAVTAGKAAASAAFVSAPDAVSVPRFLASDDAAAIAAAATGGVVATLDNLAPLERHLRALDRATAHETRHPSRSPWFVATFASLLCVEWVLRRKRGLA
jgi:hypothetical protein